MDRNFSELPESVDIVILGTDVTQSILAAACARNGLTVLHIDRNDYYGDKSCVFTFNAVEEYVSSVTSAHCNGELPISEEQLPRVGDSEEMIYLPTADAENFQLIKRDYPCCQQPIVASAAASSDGSESASPPPVQSTEPASLEPATESSQTLAENPVSQNQTQNECVSPPESATNVASTASNEVIWTKESLAAASRRFNIEMSSNLVYSTGKTVELLISSDVARYVEFKNIGKLFVFTGETFENVPCSRADVFSDTRLSLVEKRLLMRLFAVALDQEKRTDEETNSLPGLFIDYLRQTCRLPDRLIYFVQNAITMASDNCTTAEGLSRTKDFLKSCSVYGPTPFLWPMYGCAEFPQAFCRLAAVYGAVYILRSSPLAIVRDKTTKKCAAVILENGKRISCNFLASSSSYLPPGLLNKLMNEPSSSLCYDLALRAVLLSNKSLFPVDPNQQHPQLCFARAPREKFTVSIIELPDHAMACPVGSYLHQITAPLKVSEKSISSIEDHEPESESFTKFLETLFSFDNSGTFDHKPKVFWRFQFTKPYLSVNKTSAEIEVGDFKIAENLFVLPDALSNGDTSLDFDMSIAIAKLIFKEIKPDAEDFIQKMPQPPVSDDIIVEEGDLQEQEPAPPPSPPQEQEHEQEPSPPSEEAPTETHDIPN